jgi:hypothetical protein
MKGAPGEAAAQQLAEANLTSPGLESDPIVALGWPSGSARGRWVAMNAIAQE